MGRCVGKTGARFLGEMRETWACVVSWCVVAKGHCSGREGDPSQVLAAACYGGYQGDVPALLGGSAAKVCCWTMIPTQSWTHHVLPGSLKVPLPREVGDELS